MELDMEGVTKFKKWLEITSEFGCQKILKQENFCLCNEFAVAKLSEIGSILNFYWKEEGEGEEEEEEDDEEKVKVKVSLGG